MGYACQVLVIVGPTTSRIKEKEGQFIENSQNIFLEILLILPSKNPIYRRTYICGSLAESAVVEDTDQGQQSGAQVLKFSFFNYFSEQTCQNGAEKSFK